MSRYRSSVIIITTNEICRKFIKTTEVSYHINETIYQTSWESTLCVVHMVRYPLKFESWKNYKVVTADLKRVYRSATEDEALLELERFAETWDGQYPQIAKSWRTHWHNPNTLFNYPKDTAGQFTTLMPLNLLTTLSVKLSRSGKASPAGIQQGKWCT